jgi:hypothetical protein
VIHATTGGCQIAAVDLGRFIPALTVHLVMAGASLLSTTWL